MHGPKLQPLNLRDKPSIIIIIIINLRDSAVHAVHVTCGTHGTCQCRVVRLSLIKVINCDHCFSEHTEQHRAIRPSPATAPPSSIV